MTQEIAYGYCQCGCGGETTTIPFNHARKGIRLGDKRRFITGHNMQVVSRQRAIDGRRKIELGYVFVRTPEHPRADPSGFMQEHILVAEKALGRFLNPPVIVHHFNGVRSDNRNDNLVVCQNQAYHALLHQRTRAFYACGHVDWRKCLFCQKYDDPANLTVTTHGIYHNECRNSHRRELYAKRSA